MKEKEFEKLVEKLGVKYEWIDDFCIEIRPYPCWFSWEEDKEHFELTASICLDTLRENLEEIAGIKKWGVGVEKLWEKLIERITKKVEEEIDAKVETDGEFIHLIKYFKKFNAKKIKKACEKLGDLAKKYAEKLSDWRAIYDYVDHEDIRKAILSNVKFVTPCEIKRVGGSYQVTIPIDGLKLIIDEEVLKNNKKIKARLTIIPEEERIEINSLEYR